MSEVPPLSTRVEDGGTPSHTSIACACEHCGHEFEAEPDGGHRLLCGSATNVADHDNVIGEAEIDAVVTDPPYGVGIDYSSFDDSPENVAALIAGFMPLVQKWPVVALTRAAIAASIKEWGWTTPALVGEDGGLIAGHARILAARQLGIAEIPVMVAAGWTEAQKRAYVLADNQLAITGSGWDAPTLPLSRRAR
jgi:hypothetical protein